MFIHLYAAIFRLLNGPRIVQRLGINTFYFAILFLTLLQCGLPTAALISYAGDNDWSPWLTRLTPIALFLPLTFWNLFKYARLREILRLSRFPSVRRRGACGLVVLVIVNAISLASIAGLSTHTTPAEPEFRKVESSDH